MYTHLRLRSKHSLDELCQAFYAITTVDCTSGLTTSAMAHHRALTTPDLAHYHSTASAPSLRSREPIAAMDRPFTPPDSDGGNVKVVVRVRKFVKRGMIW